MGEHPYWDRRNKPELHKLDGRTWCLRTAKASPVYRCVRCRSTKNLGLNTFFEAASRVVNLAESLSDWRQNYFNTRIGWIFHLALCPKNRQGLLKKTSVASCSS